MHIFIMRHGEAELAQQNDRGRKLTDFGKQQSEKSGKWLQAFASKFDCALVSPYRRAEQTFEQVSKHIEVGQVLSSSDFVPSGNIRVAQDFVDYQVRENPDYESILIVSHMPFVSYFTDLLCHHPLSKIFATAAIIHLDYDVESSKGVLLGEYMPE